MKCTLLSIVLSSAVMLLGTCRVQAQDNEHIVFTSSDKTTVTVSSVQNSNNPAYLIDNRYKTRWESIPEDNQWVEFRFPEGRVIDYIRIHWENAYASLYEIYYLAEDEENWRLLKQLTKKNNRPDYISAGGVVTAGIKLVLKRRATHWGFSIYEMSFLKATDRILSLMEYKNLIKDFATEEEGNQYSDILLASSEVDPECAGFLNDDDFLELIQRRIFLFFWYETNPVLGTVQDRAENFKKESKPDISLDKSNLVRESDLVLASNASPGFAIPVLITGIERKWISYEQGYQRIYRMLKSHYETIDNVHGFYWHFQDIATGERASNHVELSSIDSTLFFAGVITAIEYFKATPVEAIGRQIIERADWKWFHNGSPFCNMGWFPERGFLPHSWSFACEGRLLNLIELGHPGEEIDGSAWHMIEKNVGEYHGLWATAQGPLFTYQYLFCFADLRNLHDGWCNWFDNSVNATLINRYYCYFKMDEYKTYDVNVWGLTACDYPGGYSVFGAPPGMPDNDNGTIAPAGAGTSIVFTPYFSLKALRTLYDYYKPFFWGKYGFSDAFNIDQRYLWFAAQCIGIDEGALFLSIENYRSGLVWKLFTNSDYIQRAYRRIGFKKVFEKDTVPPLDLSGMWKFNYETRGNGFEKPEYNDDNWPEIFVPDNWELQGYDIDGVGYYRKTFTLDDDIVRRYLKEKIYLVFGGIDDEAEVYCNGVLLGKTAGLEAWKETQKFNIPPQLLKRGRNVIAVKVNDLTGSGGIWKYPVELGPYQERSYFPYTREHVQNERGREQI